MLDAGPEGVVARGQEGDRAVPESHDVCHARGVGEGACDEPPKSDLHGKDVFGRKGNQEVDQAGALEKGPDTHDDAHVDEKVVVEEDIEGFFDALVVGLVTLVFLDVLDWVVDSLAWLWKKQGTRECAQEGKDAPIQKGVGEGVFVDADGASDRNGQGQCHNHGGTEFGGDVLHEDGGVEHDCKKK